MSIYLVSFAFSGDKDDELAIKKCLAQTIADDFELKSVFGVEVIEDSVSLKHEQ